MPLPIGVVMFEQHTAQLQAEAIAAYPHEAVWLITPGECRRVKNVAPEPESTFRVGKRALASAQQRGLLAVVHSHPNFPACPSAADMRGQLASGVPWGVVSTDGESATDVAWWGDSIEPPPLVGRGFRHGVTDCYSLIRDYYRVELGIVLPEYARDWEWWLGGEDFYRREFESAGFHLIEERDARPGDVWVAQLRSKVPNHGGILLDGGLGLHHPSSRLPVDPSHLSRREPLARWRHHITHWLRHELR